MDSISRSRALYSQKRAFNCDTSQVPEEYIIAKNILKKIRERLNVHSRGVVSGEIIESKRCMSCGELFHRPSGYDYIQWEDVKSCSVRCAGKLRSSEAKERRMSTIKHCLVCGDVFSKDDDNKRINWRNRKYCSKICASKARVVDADSRVTKKKCTHCSSDIPTRIPTGASITPEKYSKKLFCSCECSTAYRMKKAGTAFVIDVKPCGYCGKDRPLYTPGGKKIKPSHYRGRRYCSVECSRLDKSKKTNNHGG